MEKDREMWPDEIQFRGFHGSSYHATELNLTCSLVI